MKKILVTGGAGFIGSHLVDRLIKQGHKVVVIDNLSTGRKENLNPKAKFYKLDICLPKISEIFKKEKPQIVFHFAARIEARISVKDPLGDAKINILGSLNILENCRVFKVKKIVFASSGGEIYGDAKVIPTPEEYHSNPISPYGVAKLAVEKYLYSYLKLYNLPFLSLRLGNVYGPRQNPDGEAGIIAIFIKKMLSKKPVIIHGSGNQTKDYIFIEDAIDATVNLFKKSKTGIYNIATEKESSVLDIFKSLGNIIKESVKKKHIPMPSCGFKRGYLSIQKIKKEIGWQPKYDLDRGLKETVEWFRMTNKK